LSFLTRLRAQAIRRLQQSSVVTLVRVACWVGLVALAVMVASILDPAPLTIIFATSVGQMIGMVAFFFYLLSILADVVRGADHPPGAPGPARKFSAPDSAHGPSDSA
jgi:hypothetical protein